MTYNFIEEYDIIVIGAGHAVWKLVWPQLAWVVRFY